MHPRLIQAAQSGRVDELYALIKENPYVLEHIDAVPFINTPLHEAARYGNASFAMEMMNLKPSSARKLDTNGFSPLHVAVDLHPLVQQQQQDIEISDDAEKKKKTPLTLELLKVDPQLVRVKGKEGMTPLHLAVEKGDVNLVAEFLKSCPECIKDVNVNHQTALHIAVANDKYEVLQVLMGCIMRQKDGHYTEDQVLNAQDRGGNTALHIAVLKNQSQAIKHLLRCRTIDCNIKNTDGETVLDIIAEPKKDKNIEKAIKDKGGKRAASLKKAKTISEEWKPQMSFCEWYSTLVGRLRSSIPDGTRESLMVVCALIITATYGAALQPPGGVYPDEHIQGITHNVIGSVVMKKAYFVLLSGVNTLAFFLNIGIMYLLLPLKRPAGWFLMISLPLCISYVVSMAVLSGKYVQFFVCMSVFLSAAVFIQLAFLINTQERSPKLIQRKGEDILEAIKYLWEKLKNKILPMQTRESPVQSSNLEGDYGLIKIVKGTEVE